MIDTRLNLNDRIKVKLTAFGKDIYYHQHDLANIVTERDLINPCYPKIDEDGYTEFTLWHFMELYGQYIDMTLPNVIEPLDIIIEPEPKAEGYYDPAGNPIFVEVKVGNAIITIDANEIKRQLDYVARTGIKPEEGVHE